MGSVIIVEDHRLIAETLRAGLASVGIDAQLATPAQPAVLVATLRAAAPVLVLLDLDLGEYGDSTGVIAPLASSGIRTLVVSGTADRERIALAFEAGAFGFHPKSDGFDALVTKTSAALTSARPLDEPLRRDLLAELGRTRAARADTYARFERLTDRERDTLVALSRGFSVQAIAAQWVVSEATVRSHVRGVLAKLEVASQLAAVAYALRTGWLANAA